MYFMENRKLKLSKDVLKVLTPSELVGIVGGDTTTTPAGPGSLVGCDTAK